jgi:hypothetical protein
VGGGGFVPFLKPGNPPHTGRQTSHTTPYPGPSLSYTNAKPVSILNKKAYNTIRIREKLNQANTFKECLTR